MVNALLKFLLYFVVGAKPICNGLIHQNRFKFQGIGRHLRLFGALRHMCCIYLVLKRYVFLSYVEEAVYAK